MIDQNLQYTGERLVPGDEKLRQLLVEDLAKFHFAGQYAAGKWVLDAGCGAGQGTTYLADHAAAYVVGVDIAPEATAFAQSRSTLGNLAFGAMDVARLGFRSGSFDMVTSIEVIEHLTDPEQYVAEMRRLLKDGGLAGAFHAQQTDHIAEAEHDVALPHPRVLSGRASLPAWPLFRTGGALGDVHPSLRATPGATSLCIAWLRSSSRFCRTGCALASCPGCKGRSSRTCQLMTSGSRKPKSRRCPHWSPYVELKEFESLTGWPARSVHWRRRFLLDTHIGGQLGANHRLSLAFSGLAADRLAWRLHNRRSFLGVRLATDGGADWIVDRLGGWCSRLPGIEPGEICPRLHLGLCQPRLSRPGLRRDLGTGGSQHGLGSRFRDCGEPSVDDDVASVFSGEVTQSGCSHS